MAERKVPDRLESMLASAGVEHDIKVYPDPDMASSTTTTFGAAVWVKGIAALARGEYHEPSARDARRRIVAFFDAHLKSIKRDGRLRGLDQLQPIK